MEKQNYFEQLIKIMEIIDTCFQDIELNDIDIPQAIWDAVEHNNDKYADILILMSMLDTSYLVAKKLNYGKIITPKVKLSSEERLQLLKQNYQRVYLPCLLNYSLGKTLLNFGTKNN